VVEDGNRLRGCVTTAQIKEVPKNEWNLKNVGQLAAACSNENTISPDQDATVALDIMNQNQVSRLLVVDRGRLIGILTLKDMLKFLALKVELERQR